MSNVEQKPMLRYCVVVSTVHEELATKREGETIKRPRTSFLTFARQAQE